jgi:hypothetical protein
VKDGEDGWALDKDLAPPRLPETNYAVIDLGPYGISKAAAVSDDLNVLYLDTDGYIWGFFPSKQESMVYRSLPHMAPFPAMGE